MQFSQHMAHYKYLCNVFALHKITHIHIYTKELKGMNMNFSMALGSRPIEGGFSRFFNKIAKYLVSIGESRARNELIRLGYLNKDGSIKEEKLGLGPNLN